jgi:hypothetical protein
LLAKPAYFIAHSLKAELFVAIGLFHISECTKIACMNWRGRCELGNNCEEFVIQLIPKQTMLRFVNYHYSSLGSRILGMGQFVSIT